MSTVTELLVLQPSDSPVVGFWSKGYMPHAEGEECDRASCVTA